jgi:hypothetical protein
VTDHGPAGPAVGASLFSGLPAGLALRLVRDDVALRRSRAATALRGHPRTAAIGALDDRSALNIGDPPGPDRKALSAITLIAMGAGPFTCHGGGVDAHCGVRDTWHPLGHDGPRVEIGHPRRNGHLARSSRRPPRSVGALISPPNAAAVQLTRPRVGLVSPAMIRMSVVLPEAFAPWIASRLPDVASKLTPHSATVSP